VHRVFDRSRPQYRQARTAHLSARVENLLERDAVHQRHLRNVRRRQRALRGQVSHIGWRAYLALEEAEFDRWTHAIDRVARWALSRGKRERGRR
jgi:hypothetical protein